MYTITHNYNRIFTMGNNVNTFYRFVSLSYKKIINTRLTSMKKINYLISHKGVNPFVDKHNDLLIPKISTKTY